MKKSKTQNWEDTLAYIKDARDKMKELEALIADPKKRTEKAFWIALQRLYIPLNFAWNLRYVKKEESLKLTGTECKKAGKFPTEFDGRFMPPKSDQY